MTNAMIIDDNDMNLETLRVLLKKEGVVAMTLSSPHHLETELANADEVHVVFLDLEFPNYNGLELIKDLRTFPQFSNVPIIAYSVHTSEINEVRDAGFDGFIAKPLNIKKFPEQLRRVLAGEKVWDIG
jgi:two-component system cell cycle response regulator DivK